jgi:hypothetical protein
MSFEDDFLQGQRDCHDGIPHKPDQSDAYNRGYAAEYEMSQIKNELTKDHHGYSKATKETIPA